MLPRLTTPALRAAVVPLLALALLAGLAVPAGAGDDRQAPSGGRDIVAEVLVEGSTVANVSTPCLAALDESAAAGP